MGCNDLSMNEQAFKIVLIIGQNQGGAISDIQLVMKINFFRMLLIF
jgi:hypothetical protein